jgi:hypothetical protein
VGGAGTTLFDLTAPGLRQRRNPWEKRELRVLLARRAGPANAFVSVLQPSYAEGVRFAVASVAARSDAGEVQAVRVQGDGSDDLVVIGDAASARGVTQCAGLRFRGQQAFWSRSPESEVLWLLNGSEAQAGDLDLRARPPVSGRIVAVDAVAFTADVDVVLPNAGRVPYRLLLVTGVTDGAYEIAAVAPLPEGGARIALAGEPIMGIAVGQEFVCPTWAMVMRRADGQTEFRGDALHE